MGAVACGCLEFLSIGTSGTTPKLTGNEVLRITKLNFKAGKGKEAAEANNKMFDFIATKKPQEMGLLDVAMSTSATSIFGFQVFESKEALEKYRAGLRSELMETMKPVIDGAPEYDLVGPIFKAHKGCPKPRNDSMIVRIVQIDYKEDLSDEKLEKLFDDAWPIMSSAEGMTVWSAWADKTKRQAIVAFIFQDVATFDAYKTNTREAMMKIAGDAIKNPAVVHNLGTVFRANIFGDDFP